MKNIIILILLVSSLIGREVDVSEIQNKDIKIRLSKIEILDLDRPILLVRIENISGKSLPYQIGESRIVVDLFKKRVPVHKLESWLISEGGGLVLSSREIMMKQNESIFEVIDLAEMFGDKWREGDEIEISWDSGTSLFFDGNKVSIKERELGRGLVLKTLLTDIKEKD